jgi:Mn2+/Fe2+ NRAMP family transporter
MPEWREVWEVAGISPPPPATRGGTALEGRSRLPRTKIKSHLGFSIFIVLVSFPLGIVPLVYSLRTRRLLREGDLVAAKKSSKSAENWGVTLFVIAMIFFGLNAFVVATRL